MSPRLRFALETAREAGLATLRWFQAGDGFEWKPDHSPVTEADREAERIVRSRIAAEYPGEAVLGEEEGQTGMELTRWVVDPIDGTKSFVSGVPLFATLLSFEDEGRPVVGVAYFPALDEAVWAEEGGGCHWNGRPCRVRDEADLARAVVACGGHRHMAERGRADGLLDLAARCLATRTWGDAYGHALVATGRIDAMLDPVVQRWDVSAMAVIVREAGGRFTDFAGRDGVWDEAVSATPALHPTVIEAFRT